VGAMDDIREPEEERHDEWFDVMREWFDQDDE
jgi:hypothetical protein